MTQQKQATTWVRPERVLYGVYSLHDSPCFIAEPYASALDAEVSAVKACSTVGQAMELNNSLRYTPAPGVPETADELEDEGLSHDDPYDWSASDAVQDGDWPPMPTALSLDVFHRDDLEGWDGLFSGAVEAEVVSTTLNGDYLYMPQDSESALLALFDRLGVGYVRNDRAVANIGLM